MGTIKTWLTNHKCIIYCTAGFVLGGVLCTKINEFRIANGVKILHDHGLIRFFNPEGIEITAEELSKIIK